MKSILGWLMPVYKSNFLLLERAANDEMLKGIV